MACAVVNGNAQTAGGIDKHFAMHIAGFDGDTPGMNQAFNAISAGTFGNGVSTLIKATTVKVVAIGECCAAAPGPQVPSRNAILLPKCS